jgi:hypothetical protein
MEIITEELMQQLQERAKQNEAKHIYNMYKAQGKLPMEIDVPHDSCCCDNIHESNEVEPTIAPQEDFPDAKILPRYLTGLDKDALCSVTDLDGKFIDGYFDEDVLVLTPETEITKVIVNTEVKSRCVISGKTCTITMTDGTVHTYTDEE